MLSNKPIKAMQINEIRYVYTVMLDVYNCRKYDH